jgi:ribosome-associated translation inhibitor RaiA
MGAKLRSNKDGEDMMNAFDDKTDEMRKYLDREEGNG